jgi:hypothetical protein
VPLADEFHHPPRSANDDSAGKDWGMVLMVVIVTGTSHRQSSRLAALSWCEEPHRINLTTIRCRWIGTSGDVVRLRVVVDEGDAFPDGDDELPWFGAGR